MLTHGGSEKDTLVIIDGGSQMPVILDLRRGLSP